MFWLRNINGYVIDVQGVRDARNEPLVFGPAGTTHSWRCLGMATLQDIHVARLVEAGQVVPAPEYDAERTERPLSTVRAEYAKVFGGSAAAAPAAAPTPAPTPAPVPPPAPAPAPAPLEVAPTAEEPLAVAEAPVTEEISVTAEESPVEPAAAPAAPAAETSSFSKKKRR